MGLFRRRKKITSTELASLLADRIARPGEDVHRSLRVTAQKMQDRAKLDVQTLARELFHLRAYLLDSAAKEELAGQAGQAGLACHAELRALLEREPEFWRDFSPRTRAYDDARAREAPGGEHHLVLMARFQELLGNPDPDTLLLGLRAWNHLAGTVEQLRRELRSLRLMG